MKRWRHSLLPIPCVYLGVAIVLGLVVPVLDRHADILIGAGVGSQSARDILTSRS